MQKYLGNHLSKITEIKGELLAPYIPDPKLIRAVNYAIILKRPLLLKGEPGCGKTLLAKDVAHELGAYPERYFEWRVKSTSKAQEGIYTFDHLKRLHDVQVQSRSAENTEEFALTKYIHKGPLYAAFEAAIKEPNKPVILLIDEIDKADIDFPNDLLHELEQKSFVINELDQDKHANIREVKVPKNNNLIIFITSNNEKELPAAFLRRCLFHYIDFPDQDQLGKIVTKHYPQLKQIIVKQIISKFEDVRAQYQSKIPNDKQPSTSELLDWCRLLSHFTKESDDETLARLQEDISILLKSENAIKTIK